MKKHYILKFLEQWDFTPMEREILIYLIKSGATADEISDLVYYTKHTIRRKLTRIYECTGTKNRHDLQAKYIKYLETKLKGRRL